MPRPTLVARAQAARDAAVENSLDGAIEHALDVFDTLSPQQHAAYALLCRLEASGALTCEAFWAEVAVLSPRLHAASLATDR
jgi:hypothetical protein